MKRLKTVPIEQVITDLDLRKLVKVLPARKRQVIVWRLMGYTQTEIGLALGLSNSAISRLERQTIAWLQKLAKQSVIENLIVSLTKPTP